MTEEQEERVAQICAIIKIVAVFACITILGSAWAADASAATFGNVSPSWSTVGIAGDGGIQNQNYGIMQTFELTTGFAPATLELWLGATGTPGATLTIELCAYPDETEEFPCDGGGSGLLQTWNIDETTLPATAAPYTLAIDEGIYLYSSIPYAIVATRLFHDGSNYPTWAYNNAAIGGQDDVGGHYRHAFGGSCVPFWQSFDSASPGSCNLTDDDEQNLFRFTYLQGSLTIDALAVGGSAIVDGICVEPGDLPSGWSLDSNYVSVKYQDLASFGTFVLDTPDCSGGTYTTNRNLWNADYLITATQSGSPHTFTASATLTIDVADNPIQDPVDLITFGCEDLGYDEESIQCRMFSAFQPILHLWPYSWIVDIKTTMDSASSTPLSAVITVPSELGAGQERTLDLYSSSGTSTGLVGEINDLPEIGGKTLRELIEMFLWIGLLGAYAVLRFYSFHREDV